MPFWRKFLRALLPGRHYLDFLREPSTVGFAYFVRLALLTGFIHWLLIVAPLRTNVRLFFSLVAEKVPPFAIRQKQLFADFSQPRTLNLIDPRVPFNAVLVLDPQGKTQRPPLGPWVSFLVTRDRVWIQARGFLHEVSLDRAFAWLTGLPLPDREVPINADFWRYVGERWANRLTALTLGFLLLYTLMTKFLHYVLASGVAMVLDALWRLELEYSQMLNLCVYALTPMCVIGLFLPLLEQWAQVPYLGAALYHGLYWAIIAFVLWQVRRAQTTASLP
jgi:hypothetical protein